MVTVYQSNMFKTDQQMDRTPLVLSENSHGGNTDKRALCVSPF